MGKKREVGKTWWQREIKDEERQTVREIDRKRERDRKADTETEKRSIKFSKNDCGF